MTAMNPHQPHDRHADEAERVAARQEAKQQAAVARIWKNTADLLAGDNERLRRLATDARGLILNRCEGCEDDVTAWLWQADDLI